MSTPPETSPSGTDPEPSVVPESLSSHIPQASTTDEKNQDPFFVYQRELAPGTKLDHYEIESVLGGGGFGITYLARDILLNRNVVIKENFPSAYSHRDPLTGRINPNNAHDLENYNWALRSFLNEARTIAELDHPGIAKILSIFESNGTAYFAMEFIDGFSLEYLADQLFISKKKYTEDELKGLLYRLLCILSYLHSQGIYHRDIKPGNILLNKEGTPVLIDFGAARHANALQAVTIMTTQGYSSPEQSLGLDNTGPWSDIYSLGATFYALLTGTPPERGEVRMNEDTIPLLHTIKELTLLYSSTFLKSIDKALEPHAEHRYQSAKAWLNDLQLIPGSPQSTIKLSSHTQISPPATNPPSQTPSNAPTSSEGLRKKSALLRLSLGMLLFMVFTGILLAVIDFDKKPRFAETIKDNISSFERNHILTQHPEPETLESIIIPEIGIPMDSPSKPEIIHHFQLRLTDSAMATTGIPTPLASNIRISAIYLMETTDKKPINEIGEIGEVSEILQTPPLQELTYVTLIIKDSEGKTIARSGNKVPISSIPGQIPICFTFFSLPTLNSSKTYTCSFVDDKGETQGINLSCLLFSLTQDNSPKYPLSRIICATETKQPLDPKTNEERNIFDLLTSNKNDNLQEILSIPANQTTTPFLRRMAEKGYPLAQYKMSKIDASSTEKDNLTKGIIWLYKSAIGGYPQAQKELGSLLMGPLSKFPEIPLLPPIADKNYAQAARLLRMTLQNEDPYSLYLLGMMYGQGWGVPKSPSTASIFYARASQIDQDFHTKYLSNDNTILAYWSPRELIPHKQLLIKCEIPLELLPRVAGIKFVGTHGLSAAYISNIRLTWNEKTISSISDPSPVIPGAKPVLIPLSIPNTIMPSTQNPVYLEMEIRTEGTNSGVIELETDEKAETQKTVDSQD